MTRRVRASFPHLRLSPQVLQRLREHAQHRGVSVPELVRQMLAGYVAEPWPLSRQRQREGKSAILGAFRADQDLVRAFSRLARSRKVRVSEAIRQVVQRHLGTHGAAAPGSQA